MTYTVFSMFQTRALLAKSWPRNQGILYISPLSYKARCHIRYEWYYPSAIIPLPHRFSRCFPSKTYRVTVHIYKEVVCALPGRLGRGPTQECRKENYAWYTRRLIHSIGVYSVYGHLTRRKVTLRNSYTLPMRWHTLRFCHKSPGRNRVCCIPYRYIIAELNNYQQL
jgi:hypothetical protein